MYAYKKFDILGQTIGFEENESTKFRTWQGATLTLIVVTVCSVIGFLFGQEVYERKQAISRFSKNFKNKSSIEINKLPVVFMLALRNGTIIKNPDDYFIITWEDRKFNEKIEPSTRNMTFISDCKPKDFQSFNSLFEATPCSNNGCFCADPNHNLNYTNDYAAPNSNHLHMSLLPCDRNKRKCADDMEKILDNFYIVAMIVNSYVDANDYENPVKYYIDTQAYMASRSNYRRIYITFTNNTFVSDDGWLLESLNSSTYGQLSSVTSEINSHSYGLSSIGAFTFSSSKLSDRINRSYMKVQDFAAKLGGMINALFILTNIISYSYFRFLYITNLILLTKRIEEGEDIKVRNENSLNPVKINNFTTQHKLNRDDGKYTPNLKLINQRQELKINPTKEVKDKMKVPTEDNIHNKTNHINIKPFSFNEELNFNYGIYLKSKITCGEYHKAVDKRIEITKEKMSIETLTKAMNYFYEKNKLDQSKNLDLN